MTPHVEDTPSGGRAPGTAALPEGASADWTSCELRVGGMDCASCADAVARSLGALEGVDDVRVDVVGGRVHLRYAESKLARGDLAAAIRRVGYRVEDGHETRAVFVVGGMDCADEVRLIEGKLGKLPGVASLDFDLVRHRLTVVGTITTPEVQRALAEIGLAARPAAEGPATRSFWERRGRLVMASAAGVGVALALVIRRLGAPPFVETALLAAATLAGGWYVVPRGLRAARARALDMNFLMSIAAAGAWLIGEPGEAAATLFLFAIAELLEAYSMDRARHAITALMDLSPAEATVVRDGREERVSASDVAVGETVIVRPGEKVPVDGEVVDGRSGVNQAAITGESMPVDKSPGDEVFAGSLNGNGALRVRASKPASDTTLARIIHAVEEAQASRAPSQTFVDRFARVYTPAVVGAALLVAILPPLVGLGAWGTWVYRALTMLVVACPCALVISTPVSIVSGLAGAAHGGVLIKGGAHLENLGAVDTVCLDKTGTLTEGRPSVTEVVPLGGHDAREVLRLAAGVERHSEHPLARAVLAEAAARGIEPPQSRDFEALVGRGARATLDGTTVHVGSARLAAEVGPREAGISAAADVSVAVTRLESNGMTAVVVLASRADGGRAADGDSHELVGVLGLADRVRPEAPEGLGALRALGAGHIVMLTGDNARTAAAVARAIGVDEARAELLPADKVRVVRELEAKGRRVAFVGDGVNDAPALAAATVGVAMGAAGTDVALETADVALMADDLTRLAFAVRLARRTRRIVRQNVAFAVVVKAVFVVLALGGWATLWMAVAADMGASLAVVANGLRALGAGRSR